MIKLNDEQIVKIHIPKAYDVSVPVNVDLCSTLESLDTKIKQAKEIPLGKAEKSCIDEVITYQKLESYGGSSPLFFALTNIHSSSYNI